MIFDAFKCEVLDFVARMNLPKEMMLQNQRPVILDILDWLVKSCKGTHATKSKTGHFGHLGLTCKIL